MKGTLDQFAAVLISSIEKWTPEEKAAARVEIDRQFKELKDRALLAMPCSTFVN